MEQDRKPEFYEGFFIQRRKGIGRKEKGRDVAF
jgi:hypothetical protein